MERLTQEFTVAKPSHETEVEIRNPEGLHMRPAMLFVDLANSFDSDIAVTNQDVTVDAKSIMQMTMLAATCGTRLKIKAKGDDSLQAIEALQDLVENQLVSGSQEMAGETEG